SETEDAVVSALDAGYRHIDTAAIYRNEESVGAGVARSPIDRSDVFVTTKLWNSEQGYDSALAAIDTSLDLLGMDYVDLYLVHWPKPQHTKDTWRAMEAIQASGKARAIGVSNFLPEHLDQLLEHANVAPAINQIEFHPHLQSPELVTYCQDHGIVVEAWSPLKAGAIIADPDLGAIAQHHGVSPAQVTLRWMLQKGIVVIPKSVTPSRIIENADLYGFDLSNTEVAEIDAMDLNDRVGPDPANFDF
ncbi:MAG: aldo/keto reductase, partial [Actinomycetia bacterium]|nr:aldo/keto reductase [Actinomycetes bacterium]